ncbi:MAG: DsrE family protein [Nitrospirota bacterium]
MPDKPSALQTNFQKGGEMLKRVILVLSALLLSVIMMEQTSLASDNDEHHHSKKPCPVGTPYVDANGYPVSFEEKFGEGTLKLMHCLQDRHKVKLVMQVNAFVDSKGRPYGFSNLQNILNDYLKTNGMRAEDFEISLIIHGAGFPFVLDPDLPPDIVHPAAAQNTFKNMILNFMGQGVKVYFCMNTAAANNIKTNQLLPGIEYVTAALTALADFQSQGYKYIQP